MNKTVTAIILFTANVVFSCPLTPAKNKDVTYTKDAKPIFQKHCSNCHNQGWVDKNWMDYDTAFKNMDKIKLRVDNHSMPPGNTTNMTKEERKTIVDWVDGGGKK